MPADLLSEAIGTLRGGKTRSVEVFEGFANQLRSMEGCEFLWIITRTLSHRLRFRLVRKTACKGNIFYFSGRPVMAGEPVVGVRPYLPKFDPSHTKAVWPDCGPTL